MELEDCYREVMRRFLGFRVYGSFYRFQAGTATAALTWEDCGFEDV